MKKFFKILSASLSVLCCIILLLGGAVSVLTPSEYNVTQSSGIDIETNWPIKTKSIDYGNFVQAGSIKVKNQNYDADVMLMNVIPIKNVSVNVVEEKRVTPCGTPFGVKIFTEGVVVVGISEVQVSNGMCNPAKEAGIKKGDVIISIDGKKVNSNQDLAKIVQGCNGRGLEICGTRNNVNFTTIIRPQKSCEEGSYKAGLWVRDSSAGIGTLTFYDKDNNTFAGLGHGICDIDTGELLPLLRGDIVRASIDGVTKGLRGTPGELRGFFSDYTAIGNLCENVESGVYGHLDVCPSNNDTVIVAMKQQVRRGDAKILTTISGECPKYYDVRIESVNYNEKMPTKNMIITITDKELLEKTGGIVQGMSGSPILQNGMLIGAVTHVFINEPTRGYGIFAETMLKNCKQISSAEHKKAS